MYRGFKLSITQDLSVYFAESQAEGDAAFKRQRQQFKESIEKCRNADGSLDGTALQRTWFPLVSRQVFLSHSHQDAQLAINLSGWLKRSFGIDAFIDSSVWGYANELLEQIDQKHCKNEGAEQGGPTYNYHKRNYSTAHVHAMLSTALTAMIDHTECLLFLNTPTSVKVDGETDVTKTRSPWIFLEIEASRTIRRLTREDHRSRVSNFSESVKTASARDLEMLYELSLGHLDDIDTGTLGQWQRAVPQSQDSEASLDALYELVPAPRVGQRALFG